MLGKFMRRWRLGWCRLASVSSTAYQEGAFVDITPGAYEAGVLFESVPAGKRLVIEHVSVRAELPPGQTARAAIVVSLDGKAVSHYLVMVGQGTVIGEPTNRAVFVASHPIRLYVDPGPRPAVTVERDNSDELGAAYASMLGYLVDQ
jgi:hypothetical protein